MKCVDTYYLINFFKVYVTYYCTQQIILRKTNIYIDLIRFKGFFGCEDPLEKEMETHSSILAWKISWTEEPGGLHSQGCKRIRLDLVTKTIKKQALMEQGKIF